MAANMHSYGGCLKAHFTTGINAAVRDKLLEQKMLVSM